MVYLPAGTWYGRDGRAEQGPAWITAAAPLDTIPFYLRGGGVVPMWPQAPRSTMGYHPASIELHVLIPWEDGETRSFLHEDDGETFAFREGAFYRTEFTLRRKGEEITLDAAVTGAGYPAFARKEFVLVFHGLISTDVTLDGTEAVLDGGRLTLPNAGTGFSLRAGR